MGITERCDAGIYEPGCIRQIPPEQRRLRIAERTGKNKRNAARYCIERYHDAQDVRYRNVQEDKEETVRASPEKYLKYIPEKEKSTEQKFAEQAEQIEMLKDCLLEMSEQVYA